MTETEKLRSAALIEGFTPEDSTLGFDVTLDAPIGTAPDDEAGDTGMAEMPAEADASWASAILEEDRSEDAAGPGTDGQGSGEPEAGPLAAVPSHASPAGGHHTAPAMPLPVEDGPATTAMPAGGMDAAAPLAESATTMPAAAAPAPAMAPAAATHDAMAMPGMHDDPAMDSEHDQLMNLVKDEEITHHAIRDGDWSDPATWEDGHVPGDGAVVLVPDGVTVTYDVESNAEIGKLRVDGTLQFATDQDTLLKVDTFTVTPEGTLTIGTAADPVQADVSAKIVFWDNGAVDSVAWDPRELRHGLISHGNVEMHGQEKSGHISVAIDAKAGASQLTLAELPEHWQVGDKIVLAGTELLNSYPDTWKGTQDEVLTITRIDGKTVHFAEPLAFNHLTPGDETAGDDRNAYVANLSRNITFQSERLDPDDAPPVHDRGHVMFMHSDNVDVQNVAFVDLGRTDKSVDLDDMAPRIDPVTGETVLAGVADPSMVENFRGRYPVHVHRVGQDGDDGSMAQIKGSVVWGSPGWGFTSHDSHADLIDNVSFDVFGSHYVAETGNETGTWQGNIAIRAQGAPHTQDIGHYMAIHDFGQEGNGFWMNGRQVALLDNVAAGMRSNGFAWLNRGDGMIDTPAGQLSDALIAMYKDAVSSWIPPILNVIGNEVFATDTGLEIIRRGLQQDHDVRTHIVDFDAWDVGHGMRLDYTTNYLLEHIRLLGDQSYVHTGKTDDTVGITLAKNVENMGFLDVLIDGFETGFKVQNNFVIAEVEDRGNGVWWDRGHVFIDVRFAHVLVEKFASPETGAVGNTTVPPGEPMPAGWTPAEVFKNWLTSADLVPGRLALHLDDASLQVRWGATAEDRYLRLAGTKIDSVGEVAWPVANERIEVAYTALLNVLERIGVWTLLDGTYVTRLEVLYSDRGSAAVAKQAFLVSFPPGWEPPAGALYHGVATGFPPDTYIPAALDDPDLLATTVTDGAGHVTTVGSIAADMLEGRDVDDRLDGHYGADGIYGRDGDDVLIGSAGNDLLDGGEGDDTLFGNVGHDTLDAGEGDDILKGGSGDDTLLGDGGDDNLSGGDGQDLLQGGAGLDLLVGGAGDDRLDGEADADQIQGGEGGDRLDGGSGDDTLTGDAGDDTLLGGTGLDLLQGSDGNDTLSGEWDEDRLLGGAGDDDLDGGSGNDTLSGDAGFDRLQGGTGNDVLLGGDDGDTLDGGEGADQLDGGAGADTLLGGDGGSGDSLAGGEGDDALDGGDGNDSLSGGGGTDRLMGGRGFDTLHGEAGDDTLLGGDDNDTLYGEDGVDRLEGGQGGDRLEGGLGSDVLLGGDGGDALYGGLDADRLEGGAGDDRLVGEAADDTLLGGDGVDQLDGGDGADQLEGGEGNDRLSGGLGNDLLRGGNGVDTLYANEGQDRLYGDGGNDLLYGADDDDRLEGGGGADTLDGGLGIDRLNGGLGVDTLWGRSGADTFVVDALGTGNADTVKDFARGDRLDLSAVLGAFDPGRHDIDDFVHKVGVAGGQRLLVDVDGAAGPAGFSVAITAMTDHALDASVDQLLASGILIA